MFNLENSLVLSWQHRQFKPLISNKHVFNRLTYKKWGLRSLVSVFMSRTTQFLPCKSVCPGEVSAWCQRKVEVAKQVSIRGRGRACLPSPDLPACLVLALQGLISSLAARNNSDCLPCESHVGIPTSDWFWAVCQQFSFPYQAKAISEWQPKEADNLQLEKSSAFHTPNSQLCSLLEEFA